MKHTTEKWAVEEYSPNGDFTIRAFNGSKDIAWVNDHFNEKGDGKANADLIAAAPDMFETLEFCLFVLSNAKMIDKRLDIQKAWKKVKNTLAKAEGVE